MCMLYALLAFVSFKYTQIRTGHIDCYSGSNVHSYMHIILFDPSGRWKRTNKVNMYLVKMCIWCGKSRPWGGCVAMHFGLLALDAYVNPRVNLCNNTWPHKLANEHSLGRISKYTRMSFFLFLGFLLGWQMGQNHFPFGVVFICKQAK